MLLPLKHKQALAIILCLIMISLVYNFQSRTMIDQKSHTMMTKKSNNRSQKHPANAFSQLKTSPSPLLLKVHNQLYELYTQRLLTQEPMKTVQYICVDNGSCGGLGDRLKGAAMTFVLALFSDRLALPPNLKVPVDFSLFFELGHHLGVRYQQNQDTTTLNFIDSPASWRSFTLSSSLVYVRANQFEEAYSNFLQSPLVSSSQATNIRRLLDPLTPSEVLHCILPFIYGNPTPALAQELERVWPPLAFHFKVGVHMRTGVTAWPDPQRMALTFRDAWASKIKALCSPHTLCLVVLMSDNTNVLEDFMNNAGICQIYYCLQFEGPVLHVDRSPFDVSWTPATAFHQHKRGFLEFLALHFMDHIIAPVSQFSQVPHSRMLIPMSIWNGSAFSS